MSATPEQGREQDAIDRDHDQHQGRGGAHRERAEDEHGQRGPDQDHRAALSARQGRVDEQLDHREHGADDRELPDVVGDRPEVVAADEQQGEVREHQRRQHPDQTEPCRHAQGQQQGAPARRLLGQRREGVDHHELRQEQDRLGHDQAGGVEPGVGVRHGRAGDQDVGVRQREEREQGLAAVADLAEQLEARVPLAVWHVDARAPQREPADEHRKPAAQRDTRHGGELRRPDQHQREAAGDPADALGEVEERERLPATFSLQHSGLGAHVGEREGGDADQQCGREAFEVQHRVEHRREREADRAEHEGTAQPDPEHHPFDGDHLLGIRGDPASTGGLQPQREHADHQEGSHQRRECAVGLLADGVRREHGVAVGRQVHDPHRDRDDGAAAQPATGLGRHLAHGGEAYVWRTT